MILQTLFLGIISSLITSILLGIINIFLKPNKNDVETYFKLFLSYVSIMKNIKLRIKTIKQFNNSIKKLSK